MNLCIHDYHDVWTFALPSEPFGLDRGQELLLGPFGQGAGVCVFFTPCADGVEAALGRDRGRRTRLAMRLSKHLANDGYPKEGWQG